MTSKETTDYNKRCATFLGWDYNKSKDRWNEDMHHQYSFVESVDLLFHSDWNWIREVVEAIEKHNISYIMERKVKNTFNIESDGIKIYYRPNNEYLLHLELKPYLIDGGWEHTMYKNNIVQLFDFKNKSKMEAVVEAINKFLIWYENEQTRDNSIV